MKNKLKNILTKFKKKNKQINSFDTVKDNIQENLINIDDNTNDDLIHLNDNNQIDDHEFFMKNLEKIKINKNIVCIGKRAYSYNKIAKLIIPNNVRTIKDEAFANNKITDVQIPGNLILGKGVFAFNDIVDIQLPNNMEIISEACFRNNYLSNIKLPDDLVTIEDFAFAFNLLESLKIPSKVKKIGDFAFMHCNLTELIIPDNVDTIGCYSFSENNIEKLKISNNIKVIPDNAFQQNKLTNVEFSNNVNIIGKHAFSKNLLINIIIPENVQTIGMGAFKNNKLISVRILNGVKQIEEEAFLHNNLKIVNIPKSVTYIGNSAFDSDVEIFYDNVLIKRELIEKYGTSNIIKIYEISKKIPQEKIDISKNILDILPSDKDSIKGYISNKKKFDSLIIEDNYKDEEYKDIFKMCFILGLFSKPDDEIILFIKRMLNENKIDHIHQMFTSVILKAYNPKLKEIIIKLYNENKIEYNNQNIIARLCSSFEKIYAYTIKKHEEEISKKNTEIKRLRETSENTKYLENELEILKKTKKDISYEDIIYYIKNNIFEIREGNEILKEIAPILSIHTDQTGFDKIQDVYEQSKSVEKTISLTIDKSDKDFKYHWSKSDNPINIILGYLVDCCAKLGGAGQDIMIQSMINPDVANLILYDENNNVIGKATAYYNKKKKYILFNNAETKEITTKGLKSEKQRQKECLEALIRGTLDTVKVLQEKGEIIKEVRIGMLRNDLKEAIKEYGLEISHELLEAYNWKGYEGDASDIDEGQAVLYKDDKISKNKNI